MGQADGDRFEQWYAALERRHLESLTFSEVRRALQALSGVYVNRRADIVGGAALNGSGKRAAFALFYGPLHYRVASYIVEELRAHDPPPATIEDLGCGTGAAGAAWAVSAGGKPVLRGVDLNPWAVRETRWSWSRLGLRGTAHKGRVEHARAGRGPGAVLLAYTANELAPAARDRLFSSLLEPAASRRQVLVVEPVARRVVPWWDEWAGRFVDAGGRAETWRIDLRMPGSWQLLDRAAGLDHREVKARSLYLPG